MQMDFYILKEKPKKIIADFVYCRDTCGSDNLNILTVLNAFQEGIVNEIIVELKERFPIYEDTNLPGFFKTDYTFVMKNGKLILYKGGNKMCTVRKETAGKSFAETPDRTACRSDFSKAPGAPRR